MELIHIKVFNLEKAYDVWIEEDCKVNDFIEDVIHLWFKEQYAYEHFLYHIDEKKILVSHLSFKENHVIHSDQLILF